MCYYRIIPPLHTSTAAKIGVVGSNFLKIMEQDGIPRSAVPPYMRRYVPASASSSRRHGQLQEEEFCGTDPRGVTYSAELPAGEKGIVITRGVKASAE